MGSFIKVSCLNMTQAVNFYLYLYILSIIGIRKYVNSNNIISVIKVHGQQWL